MIRRCSSSICPVRNFSCSSSCVISARGSSRLFDSSKARSYKMSWAGPSATITPSTSTRQRLHTSSAISRSCVHSKIVLSDDRSQLMRRRRFKGSILVDGSSNTKKKNKKNKTTTNTKHFRSPKERRNEKHSTKPVSPTKDRDSVTLVCI